MHARAAFVAAALCFAQVAYAQSAAEHIAQGDKAYAERNAAEALTHYDAAIKADSTSYEALWKASRTLVDLGEANKNDDARMAEFKKAQGFAERAVAVNPKDAEGHFHLARALGKTALTMGKKDRVKFAGIIRDHALEALKINPNHPGALHVMGVWNAEIMRLSGVTRFLAKNLLGGKVFSEASWDNAVSYMERSVAAEPDRIVHHLDLGKIYDDVDQKAKAREQYEDIARLPVRDYNDPTYKQEAAAALAKLK